jgi:hypothetical protein
MVLATDLRHVLEWARQRVPPNLLEQIRIEVDTTPPSITILECRTPWDVLRCSDWPRMPIAGLRYGKSRKLWTLYWRDCNKKSHLYNLVEPTHSIEKLLDEIDRDPTAIFWE